MTDFENENNGNSCKENSCNCSKNENLLNMVLLTNTITSLALAVVALVLVFKFIAPPQPPMPPQAIAQEQQEEEVVAQDDDEKEGFFEKLFNFNKKEKSNQQKAIFKGKGMTLDEAMKDDKYIAVLFYADWCPHCQNFAPTFKKLSKDRGLKKTYNFVRLNSDLPETRAIMQEYKVEGFPAFFLVNPKTNEKQFISNSLLFGDTAKENLKGIMEGYAESRDKN